jgi:O-antigen ligase
MNASSSSFPAVRTGVSTRSSSRRRFAGPWLLWIFLFSVLFGGVTMTAYGRTPVLSYFDILFGLTILLLFAKLFVTDFTFEFPDKTVLWLSCSCIGAQLISLFFNRFDVPKSILAIKVSIFSLLIYFVSLSVLKSERDIRSVVHGLVFFATGVSILLCYYYVKVWSRLFTANAVSNKDLIALAFDPNNGLAVIMVFLLPLSVGLAFSARGARRILFLVTSMIILLGLVIAMSRGAFASLICGLLLALPLFIKTGLKMRSLIVPSVILASLLYLAPSQLLESNVELFSFYNPAERSDLPRSFTDRLEMLQAGWRAFLDHPMVGIGANGTYEYNWNALGYPHLTTNWLVREFAELGLLGGVPFTILMAVLVIRSYRLCLVHPREKYFAMPLFVGLLVTLINGMTEATFPSQQYAVVFWISMALVYAKSRLVLQ